MSSRFPAAFRSRSARRWSAASVLRDRRAWTSLACKPASTRSPTSSSDPGSPRLGPSGFPPIRDGLRELGSLDHGFESARGILADRILKLLLDGATRGGLAESE